MDFIKDNKIMLAVVVLAVLAVGYYMMSGSATGSGAALTSTDDASIGSQPMLVMLSSLQSIRLDNTIFTDPTFVALTDFGVVIAPEPLGRHNPFVFVGQSGATASSSKALNSIPLKLPSTSTTKSSTSKTK